MQGLGSIIAVALPLSVRALEHKLHQSNYRYLIFVGGEELAPTQMKSFYTLGVLLPLLAFAESLFHAGPSPERIVTVGIYGFAAALLLRLWVVWMLRSRWTMRCVAVPGWKPCTVGPYRFINNPEYVSRLLEGLSICAYFAAYNVGAVFALTYCISCSRIMQIERRQLDELSGASCAPGSIGSAIPSSR